MFSSGRRFDRTTGLFLALLAVSFLIATFDVRAEQGGVGGVLREGTQTMFTPLQKATDFVTGPIVGFIDGVSNIAGLREENERLQQLVQELEQRVLETESLERRLSELEAVNDLQPPGELATVTARIYAGGPSDFDHVRFIDKGSADGVVKGQAVIDENGLVGRIDLVGASNARVRLIDDPLVSVGVRVTDTGETGWVSGQGTGRLRLEMFRATEEVFAGYPVITDGSRFPPGIPVGTISEDAAVEVGFALRTTVLPMVELSRLDFVRVVVGWSPLEDELGEQDSRVEPPPIVDEEAPTQ